MKQVKITIPDPIITVEMSLREAKNIAVMLGSFSSNEVERATNGELSAPASQVLDNLYGFFSGIVKQAQ